MKLPTKSLAALIWAAGGVDIFGSWWPIIKLYLVEHWSRDGWPIGLIWKSVEDTIFAVLLAGFGGGLIWVLGEIRDRIEGQSKL